GRVDDVETGCPELCRSVQPPGVRPVVDSDWTRGSQQLRHPTAHGSFERRVQQRMKLVIEEEPGRFAARKLSLSTRAERKQEGAALTGDVAVDAIGPRSRVVDSFVLGEVSLAIRHVAEAEAPGGHPAECYSDLEAQATGAAFWADVAAHEVDEAVGQKFAANHPRIRKREVVSGELEGMRQVGHDLSHALGADLVERPPQPASDDERLLPFVQQVKGASDR